MTVDLLPQPRVTEQSDERLESRHIDVHTPIRGGDQKRRHRAESGADASDDAELTALQAEGEAVITCEFCNRRYRFDRESLASFAA